METEKVDKAALGYDYKGQTDKHQSQKGEPAPLRSPPLNVLFRPALVSRSDYSKGFGGKFGVEREKVDKAALGYDYRSETEKHQSQKGEATLGVRSSDLESNTDRVRVFRLLLRLWRSLRRTDRPDG